MSTPIIIALYSDVHCPYAYVTAYRLRQLGDAYRDLLPDTFEMKKEVDAL